VYYSTVLEKQSDAMPLQMGGKIHDRHIGILVDEEHYFAAVSAIIEAFQMANISMPTAGEKRPYRVTLLSRLGGKVISSSMIATSTRSLDMYSLRDFDALFVANHDMRATPDSHEWLLRWLSKLDGIRYGRNRIAQCGGVDLTSSPRSTIPVFWFGHPGSEEYATTKRATQLALEQIARDHTDDSCIKIAVSVSPPVQMIANPRSDNLNSRPASRRIRESCRWIRENFTSDISVSAAAAVAAMSERNYVRRFKSECGVTPLEYVMRIRFESVLSMLVETELPFDKIARRCGFGSGDRMGRLFRKRYDMSLTAYRELYGTKGPVTPGESVSE
jgi:transcriptional regulator GlxA family with amidase domain